MRIASSRTTIICAPLLALTLFACATNSDQPGPKSAPWWTFNPVTRTCVQANVTPDGARAEARARGAACRRLRSFDPDAYILMCTSRRGDKLAVRIAGFGRDETACRAAGRDVVRHLNEVRRKK